MRIYDSAYKLMSEMARDLMEMGLPQTPKSYQNKDISKDPSNFSTKDLIMKSYCLVALPDPHVLFTHTHSHEWADAEFEERIDPTVKNPGEAWKLRSEVWNQFLNDLGEMDYTYSQRMNLPLKDGTPLLERVIKELEQNPDTRQAIIPIFSPEDINGVGGAFRIPCSMYYQALIRPNTNGEKEIHLVYSQRSCDFITHFGNDVYLAWLLKDYIAYHLGIRSGYLYHTIGSLHVYSKDFPTLKTCIQNLL